MHKQGKYGDAITLNEYFFSNKPFIPKYKSILYIAIQNNNNNDNDTYLYTTNITNTHDMHIFSL